MIILNIPGTLLDSSLIAEKPRNATIKSSMITESRRVVFRPWLIQFLCIH
jgi:hypothetical protein